jgi:DNA-binding CsgD family transcriptional regulator
MAGGKLAGSAGSFLNRIVGYPKRRSAANDDGDLTRMRLQEALDREAALLRQIRELVREHREVMGKLLAGREDAVHRMASLTPRQRQIMELVLDGHPSKSIAADLGINQRTVETHRASIMKKTGSKSLPALARLALIAAWTDAPDLSA